MLRAWRLHILHVTACATLLTAPSLDKVMTSQAATVLMVVPANNGISEAIVDVVGQYVACNSSFLDSCGVGHNNHVVCVICFLQVYCTIYQSRIHWLFLVSG